MTTCKYLIEVPIRHTVENECLKYIVDLICAKRPGEITFLTKDVAIIQAIGNEPSNNGLVLAEGIINISHWLSFRNFGDADINGLVQMFCGDTKDAKREIARALKRVMGWVTTWSDLCTPTARQLKDPTCGHILFDKKLRHRKINCILDCDVNCKVEQTHLTIADIHLTMTISKWMTAFEHEMDYIIAIIPAVVNYVKAIRSRLRVLEVEHTGMETLFKEYFGRMAVWVDTVEVSAGSQYGFKFTQNEKAVTLKTSKRAGSESSVVLHFNIEEVERKAQELFDLVEWRDPSFSNGDIDYNYEALWEKMKLPAGREVRKRQQIISLLREINAVLPVGGIAVEFCAGGGYVGIPLAVLRPDCTVLLTDMNSVSIMYAKQRVEALQLTNVKFLRQELAGIEATQHEANLESIENLSSKEVTETEMLMHFHVGIALHACGTATDAVLRICTRAGASFVVSPCCYGFLQHQANHSTSPSVRTKEALREETEVVLCGSCVDSSNASAATVSFACTCEPCISSPSKNSIATPSVISTSIDLSLSSAAYSSYPASNAFRSSGWQGLWFTALCSQADRTFWSHDARAAVHNEKGRLAMRAVDADRLLAAQELGYAVYGTFMSPAEASVKNHILVGMKG